VAEFPRPAAATLMTGYYVYIVDKDGHVQSRREVVCNDDEEAKQRAKLYVDGHGVELWQQARKVAEFPPED